MSAIEVPSKIDGKFINRHLSFLGDELRQVLLRVAELDTTNSTVISEHLNRRSAGNAFGERLRTTSDVESSLKELRQLGLVDDVFGVNQDRVTALADSRKRCESIFETGDGHLYKDRDYPVKGGPAGFWSLIEKMEQKAGIRDEIQPQLVSAVDWRSRLRTRSELAKGPIEFFIKDFLPEGVTFLGGLSGSGKSWLALSMAKALTTGRNFLGCYEVPKPQSVIYLAPESGEKSLRTRLDILNMPEDRFYCTTVNDGGLQLNDAALIAAVQELRPVVFLDTAVRFLHGAEENSASDISAGLTEAIFTLLRTGARAVVGIHHSPKSSANADSTLENTLRGTGDLGAMADAVYAVRCSDQETLTMKVSCVKARDFEPLRPFSLQGRPYLSETGDFGMLTAAEQSEADRLVIAIQQNPQASYQELQRLTGIYRNRVPEIAEKAGWVKPGKHASWIKTQTIAAAPLLAAQPQQRHY